MSYHEKLLFCWKKKKKEKNVENSGIKQGIYSVVESIEEEVKVLAAPFNVNLSRLATLSMERGVSWR